MHRHWISIAILPLCLAALGVCLTSCGRSPSEQVVLYVSVDEHFARQVIDRFQKSTGISVLVVGDTEAKKNTGLVDRIRSERDRPRADVFWSSEIVLTIAMAEEGLLDEHLSDATADWPRDWRDSERRWFAFAARPRVIVYAPDRLSEDQRPQTWMDLTQLRFRDKIVMADPRFGTTGTHLAVMLSHWDRTVMPGYFSAWAQGLAANNVRLLPSGNAGVVDAVAKGEAEIGLTDADDVWAAQARGLKVALLYPAHDLADDSAAGVSTGGGTLLIPNTVCRIKGGPNPAAAVKLIDFLVSEEVERMLAESDSHNVPMRESLRAAYPQYDVPDPLKVDWRRAAPLRDKALEQFFAAIDATKRERAEVQGSRRDAVDQSKHDDSTAPAGTDDTR